MTIDVAEPSVISVSSTSDNVFDVTITSPATITVTVSAIGIQGSAGVGVPLGGTIGMRLVKKTNSDYDTEWAFLPPVAAGVDKDIQYNDAGITSGDTDLKWDKNTKTLRLGIVDDAPLPNNPLAMVGAIDGYLQVNIRNTTEGESASSDYVATADNGTDSTHFIDMGINSSVYDVPEYSGSTANDGYLLVEGGDLDLMTTEEVHIHAGGFTASDKVIGFRTGAIDIASDISVTNRPEIYYGTGSPPSATGKLDGTLFFKYTP